MTVNVRLHRDEIGLVTAMSTNAADERDFLAALNDVVVSELRQHLIDGSQLTASELDALSFTLARVLPQAVEICCKLRGYKADVAEHRIIIAGRVVPTDVVDAFPELSVTT